MNGGGKDNRKAGQGNNRELALNGVRTGLAGPPVGAWFQLT